MTKQIIIEPSIGELVDRIEVAAAAKILRKHEPALFEELIDKLGSDEISDEKALREFIFKRLGIPLDDDCSDELYKICVAIHERKKQQGA